MDGKRRYTCPALVVLNGSDHLARRSYIFEENKFTIEPPATPCDLNLPLVSCQFDKMVNCNDWVVTAHGNTQLMVNDIKVEPEIPYVIKDNDEILLVVAHFKFVRWFTPYAQYCAAKKPKFESLTEQNTELENIPHSQPSTSCRTGDEKPLQSSSSANCVVSALDFFRLSVEKMDEDSGVHSVSDISDDSNSEYDMKQQCPKAVKTEETSNSDDCVIIGVTPGVMRKKKGNGNSKDADNLYDDCQIVDVKSPLKPKRASKKDAFGPNLADNTNKETDTVSNSTKSHETKIEMMYDAEWKEARLNYLEKGRERLEFKLRGYQLLNQSLSDERIELLKRLQDMEKLMLDNVQLVSRIKTLEEDKRCKDELGRTISNMIDENSSLKNEIKEVTSIASMLEKENSTLKQKNEETERKLQEQSDAISCINQDENGDSKCPTTRKMKTKLTELMESEFRCSICEELFIEPIVTNCNHIFCSHCLQEWRKKKPECPFCRTVVTRECKITILDDYIASLSKMMSDKLYGERMQTVMERKKSAINAPPPRMMKTVRRLQLRTPEQLNATLANPRDYSSISMDSFTTLGSHREADTNSAWPFIPAAHTSTSIASLGYGLLNLSQNTQTRSIPARNVAPVRGSIDTDFSFDRFMPRSTPSTSASVAVDAANYSQRNRIYSQPVFRTQSSASSINPLSLTR